jgi:glucose dehydrogenase
MKRPEHTLVLVLFAAFGVLAACSKSWPTFRHNTARAGHQTERSSLSDPAKVANLKVVWTFSPTGAQGFYSSPIVHDGRVFFGNGFFYALDEKTGALLWQYPTATPLTSTCTCNPSSFGIASSAVATRMNGKEAVIFGAPDHSSGTRLGDGHLIALGAETGAHCDLALLGTNTVVAPPNHILHLVKKMRGGFVGELPVEAGSVPSAARPLPIGSLSG